MMRTEIKPLLAFQSIFGDLVTIAQDAVDLDPDKALGEIKHYAYCGARCVVLFDGDTPIGYVIYGPTSKFVNWVTNLNLKLRLSREGINEHWTCCHVHLRRKYLKGGHTAMMALAYCQDIIDAGGTHLLLWGYATDELCNYVFSRPGSMVLEGETDFNGRRVGVRDLQVFVDSAKGETI